MPDFLRVEVMGIMPAHCVGCHSQGRGVDTGVDLELNGRVYFCDNCIAQLAHILGWLPGPAVAELRDELEEARLTADRLEAELDLERDRKTISVSELAEVVSNRQLTQMANRATTRSLEAARAAAETE